MKREILILHAYSADNLGDGLLVEQSIAWARAVYKGDDCRFTICASYPETFDIPEVQFVCSRPTARGYSQEYLRILLKSRSYSAVFAVGGGYLRAGSIVEMLKTALIHGPQLVSALRAGTRCCYLPQSVGPLRFGTRMVIDRALARVGVVFLRDDRSLALLRRAHTVRCPDLAIVGSARPELTLRGSAVDPVPILSVRSLKGALPPLVLELAHYLGEFEGYVQSETGSNRDLSSMQSLNPCRIVGKNELMLPVRGSNRRVVIAVRLHAALMAVRAGHLVIHLAYERKGFGAFDDLGLRAYVHNVNAFEPARVVAQVEQFMSSASCRREYDRIVEAAFAESQNSMPGLLSVSKVATS